MPITVACMPHTIGSSATPWARRPAAHPRSTPGGGAAREPPCADDDERRAMSTPGIELETVNLRISEGVATVELNRPDTLNAWNGQFGDALRRSEEHSSELQTGSEL